LILRYSQIKHLLNKPGNYIAKDTKYAMINGWQLSLSFFCCRKTSIVMKQLIISGCVFTVFMWAACFSSVSLADTEQEKEAIKAIIAQETEAYYQQDFETWKSTYVNEAWFRSYGYWGGYTEKVRCYNGFDTFKNFKKKQFEQNRTLWIGSTEKRTNENIRVHGNMAWYTFDQASYEKDTHKLLGKSLETRILEKIDGRWRIAYLGFHYLPLQDTSRAIN